MQHDPVKLTWLPLPDVDIMSKAETISSKDETFTDNLSAVLQYRLEEGSLDRLGVQCRRYIDSITEDENVNLTKVCFVGNCTLDYIADAVRVGGARHGVLIDTVVGAYDQILQESLDPQSISNTASADIIFIHLDERNLPFEVAPWDPGKANSSLDDVLELVRTVIASYKEKSSAQLIVSNVLPSLDALFGNLDQITPGSSRVLVERYNSGLNEIALEYGAIVFDVKSIAGLAGMYRWHDLRLWNMGKIPCHMDVLPLFGDYLGRLIASIRGKQRKVLVLDLDNTVWGGIIGDDGIDGINIAQGDAVGEAHLQVQKQAVALKSRGIVLAVCSKNTDNIARTPFQEHPEMILKEDDIAVFQANWTDKASNLEAIAKTLNLGLDSFVFLDDNPAERSHVRRTLPMVAVPEIPADPAEYAAVLSFAGYFEAVSFVAEDAERAEQYRMNAKRAELATTTRSLDDYVISLEMNMSVKGFDSIGRKRIAQLINKTNQFNLTTRRYTESEVAGFEIDENCFGLQIRLTDRFGDNGMISVVMAFQTESHWDIDTWLMSCRVLGRGVEKAVLGTLVKYGKAKGVKTLKAKYIATDRNGLVEDHYDKLGFTVTESGDGFKSYEMDISQYETPEHYINISYDDDTLNDA